MSVESLAELGSTALSYASEVGSYISDLGTEFLSNAQEFIGDINLPSGEALANAYEKAGSAAGSADWYDAVSGSVTKAAEAVTSGSGFSLDSITSSLPSFSEIKTFAGGISTDFSGFVKQAQGAIQTYQKVAPAVNAASSALGIQNPINQIIAPVSQAVGIAGAASGIAGRVSAPGGSILDTAKQVAGGLTGYNIPTTTGGVVNTAAQAVTAAGFGLNVLTDPQLAQVTKNATLINFLNDPGTAQPSNYNTAVETVRSLTPVIEGFQTQITGSQLAIDQENKNISNYQEQLNNPELTAEERAAIEANIQNSYDNIAAANQVIQNTQPVLESTAASYTQAADVIANTESTTTRTPGSVQGQVVDQYSMVKNTDGTYSIFDRVTGDTVQSGLSQQQAILQAQDLNIATPGISINSNNPVNDFGPAITGVVNDFGPAAAVATANGITVGQVNNARFQQSVRALRNNKAQSTDWRVRLRLAPNSQYLYNDNNNGLLQPLRITDGVVFPYTPSIETAYKANYEAYDLTHSNYRGYFYKSSYVDAVNVRCTFTAQDTKEANYLLAVIHFFRSCTKMFYGQDPQRGAPPPLVYLSGYGDFQFAEHPCVISQFNYTLPPDVDYIRAQNNLQSNTNQLNNRLRNPIANNPLAYSVNRLLNNQLIAGALGIRPEQTNNLGNSDPTYVPTKMEIAITLLPTQSRSNISNNFSVQNFANGNLLKDGYW